MATILRDGFDSYSSSQQALGIFDFISTDVTFVATTRFSHGQSASLGTSGLAGEQEVTKNFTMSSDTVFLNFAFRKAGVHTGTHSDNIFFVANGTVQITIRMNGSGNIEVFRGNLAALLLTYAGAIPGSGSWSHYQFKIRIHDTLGSIEIRRDGSDFNDAEVFNVDTKAAASDTGVTQFHMQMASNNPTARQYDDLWMFDNTVVAGQPSDWIGDVRAWQILADSDSAVSMSRSAGLSNFALIDEAVQSSADYVFANTAGAVDEYGNPGFAIPLPENILGLSIRSAAQKMDAGLRTISARVRSGATVSDAAGKTPSTGVRTEAFRFDLNPDTGLVWTAAEIAAMKFGPKIAT